MKFSRYILSGIITCFLWMVAPARQMGGVADSSSTKCISLIDSLNEQSRLYTNAEKKDSAIYYARLAYNESKGIHYAHGVATSLVRQAQIAKHFDDDFDRCEALGRESLAWFDSTSNKKGIGDAYFYLLYATFSQSRFQEALYYANKMYDCAAAGGSKLEMINALSWTFGVYRQSGNYERSFEYVRKVYDLAQQMRSRVLTANALYGMAQLHMLIEDYPTALNYFRRVLQMDDNETRSDRIRTDNDIWFKMEFTEVFSHLQQFDSAWHYYQLYKPNSNRKVYMRVYWVSTGECHYLQKNYRTALQHFERGLALHRIVNDRNEVMRALLDIGKTYLALEDCNAASKYGREGLDIALQVRSKQYIRDGYQILSTVYDKMQNADSANFYFRKYITFKEEVLDDQTKAKVAAYGYHQRIALIEKEKQVQQATLQKQRLMKEMLIAGLILLTILAAVVVRTILLQRKNERQSLEYKMSMEKLNTEKIKSDLLQQSAELEMKALRAQMNPHFIFNSLNSINRFILRKNTSQASAYLTKFSKLMRLVLQHSHSSLITLENELASLQLYLELESLRFDHHFQFVFEVDEDVDVASLKVPPLIIQPFAENAVWHGLMPKAENGFLRIHVYLEGDLLCCKITDNGIGRKRAAGLKSKSASLHKSFGMQITAKRIEILQGQQQTKTSVQIADLVLDDGSAGGTEVLLKIPTCYD